MQLLYNDAQLFMPATLWLWQPSVYIWTELNFYCISPLLLLFFYSFFFQYEMIVLQTHYTLMVSQCSSQCNRSRPSWIDLFFKRGRSAWNWKKKKSVSVCETFLFIVH